MNLQYYESSSGRNLILDYIESLTKDEQVDAYSVLQSLEEEKMDQVHFKCWKGKIYEVYFYKHNRIFYVTADGNNMYLLHACRKQKGRTEKTDRRTVLSRAKELSKEFSKEFV